MVFFKGRIGDYAGNGKDYQKYRPVDSPGPVKNEEQKDCNPYAQDVELIGVSKRRVPAHDPVIGYHGTVDSKYPPQKENYSLNIFFIFSYK